MREYELSLDKRGQPFRLTPLGLPQTPCDGRLFSLPIGAKFGREMAVFDGATMSSHIVFVDSSGRCIDRLDLGFPSGKLAFSHDGKAIAFSTSRMNVDLEGELLKPEDFFYRDAFVLVRQTGRLIALSSNKAVEGSMFPEFIADGRLIVLDEPNLVRNEQYLRILVIR